MDRDLISGSLVKETQHSLPETSCLDSLSDEAEKILQNRKYGLQFQQPDNNYNWEDLRGPFKNVDLFDAVSVEANFGRQEIQVAYGHASYLRPRKRKRLRIGDDVVFEQDQLHFEANKGSNGSNLKDALAWVFLINNFTLELPSVVFDQLSSKHHPVYALILMLISSITLMACIGELIYKGKKERVIWQWRDRVPWFYCPRTGKSFGTLWEMIGLACAVLQCIPTIINYSYIHRHGDGPIKTCALPILFAFGLLCSKYLEKPHSNSGGNPTDQYGGSTGGLNQVRVVP
ncbi:Serine/threonine-protein kinase PBS1 [Theobroma cacao]|uniref:Serine/threonine-protein kinase PBS1 n=1 Tax=Theobroma cacao TaxID=3641 RepID=A0A061E4A8_THECC|nr:Serine/threonine-protein kinase PBS1 [Theobroma cacao]